MDASALIASVALITAVAPTAIALARPGGPVARIDRALDRLNQITGTASTGPGTAKEGTSA